MIDEILREIGLSDYETKVYLALLELGKGTSGEILQKANLNTGKIYEILGSLKNKGIISEIVESGVRKFYPADPDKIVDYLSDKKKTIEDQEKKLSNILPEILSKIDTKKEDVKVEVFYGLKGLKTSRIKEVKRYSKKETIRVFGIMGRGIYPKEVYDFFIYNIYPKRTQSGVQIRKILGKDSKDISREQEKTAKVKYFPYTSPVTIATIGDLTLIDIHSEPHLTISIESKEVTDSFIQQFELLWKIAKK